MGVFRARHADRADANVGDEDVRANAVRHFPQVEGGSIIDGTALQEKLAALVKPYAPAGNHFGFAMHE